MEIIFGWMILSLIAAVIADRKGRSGVWFFFLSLVFSPLIGIIAALIAKPDADEVDRQAVLSGRSRKCPYCAELVKADAVVCRFCGRDLPGQQEPIEPEAKPEAFRI